MDDDPIPRSPQDAETIRSTLYLILDAPISCLSFSPKHQNVLIVGTYQLEETRDRSPVLGRPQRRKGSVWVLEVIDDSL